MSTRIPISILSPRVSLFGLGIIFKCCGWVGIREKNFSLKFVSSQMWCHLNWGGWCVGIGLVQRRICLVQFYIHQAKSYLILGG